MERRVFWFHLWMIALLSKITENMPFSAIGREWLESNSDFTGGSPKQYNPGEPLA
jgi:hypothetical protein